MVRATFTVYQWQISKHYLFMGLLCTLLHKTRLVVQQRFLSELPGIFADINHSWGKNINTLIQSFPPMWARIGIKKRETEGSGSMCVCAFKSPQARVNVGKVAQCLSHDPWGEAVFLLDPWMKMWHQRKPKKGTTNIATHPFRHVTPDTETLGLPVCFPAHTCC